MRVVYTHKRMCYFSLRLIRSIRLYMHMYVPVHDWCRGFITGSLNVHVIYMLYSFTWCLPRVASPNSASNTIQVFLKKRIKEIKKKNVHCAGCRPLI